MTLSTMESVRIEPMDQYNEELLRNVHPPDWVNPKPKDRYNLVVIGAGTAGLVTAAGAAGLGAKVALIERRLMGGDCLNVGCVPSKCLLASAHVFGDIMNAEEFGVAISGSVNVDFGAVMERMRRIRSGISHHDSAHRFSGLGVDVFIGDAAFTSNGTVKIGDIELRYKKAVICTGARAALPPIDGLAETGCLTNETVFSLTELPRRLAVIGAGPIGCELAQSFRRFGSDVHLIEVAPQFLTREDPDAAKTLYEQFLREGIHVYLNTKPVKVTGTAGSKVVTVEQDGNITNIEVDEILVGAGRAPNVDGLNLEAVGVQYDNRRGVVVNDFLQTTNPKIYAAGDICMDYKFTHAADFAARAVIQNALFMGRAKVSSLFIPWCTYTQPEIAHVGLYGHEAEKHGIAIDTYVRSMSEVDRALAEGDTEGFVKIHTVKGKDKILGATIVARNAGDMISEIAVAMKNKIGLGKLAGVIHPYPTQAEAIRQLGDAYNRTRLSPFVKTLFRWWLS